MAVAEPPVVEAGEVEACETDSQVLETSLPNYLLTRIAQECVESQWWETTEKSS